MRVGCFGALVCLRKTHRGLDVQRTPFWWLKHVYITVLFVAYCIFPNAVSNIVYFHPYYCTRGNDPIWFAHIFQIGWNHKLGNASPTLAFTIFSPIPCMNSSCRASGSIQGICGRTVPSPPLEAWGFGNLRINEGLSNLEHVQEKENHLLNIISGITYQI